jgi:hypothetical protein
MRWYRSNWRTCSWTPTAAARLKIHKNKNKFNTKNNFSTWRLTRKELIMIVCFCFYILICIRSRIEVSISLKTIRRHVRTKLNSNKLKKCNNCFQLGINPEIYQKSKIPDRSIRKVRSTSKSKANHCETKLFAFNINNKYWEFIIIKIIIHIHPHINKSTIKSNERASFKKVRAKIIKSCQTVKHQSHFISLFCIFPSILKFEFNLLMFVYKLQLLTKQYLFFENSTIFYIELSNSNFQNQNVKISLKWKNSKFVFCSLFCFYCLIFTSFFLFFFGFEFESEMNLNTLFGFRFIDFNRYNQNNEQKKKKNIFCIRFEIRNSKLKRKTKEKKK